MRKSKFDRFVSVVVVGICLIKAVLYGGSKPPVSTNTPPMKCFSPRPMMSPPAEQTENEPSATYHLSLIPQTSWNTRGAYCDWIHVDFPGGFAFPTGTNLLAKVTVLAWGELCSQVEVESGGGQRMGSVLVSLPQRVSIEPDNSSVSYGLTASNSYLFVWENVCVEREATNRINASIELFRNGSMAITTQPTDGSQPPITDYRPPTPPPGFVGEGLDTNWLASTFSPADYAAITNKGYARWLDEDFKDYNVENGHCKGTVTVHSMPPNGEPCYLVCGPYKVIVTEPGDYDFPIDVLTDYYIRTYPTDVPVSFTYDEGYYPDEDVYGSLLSPSGQSNNPRLLGAPPSTSILANVVPAVYLAPCVIEFTETMSRHVTIWCNMAQAAWEYVTLGEEVARLNFINRHEAEVRDWITLKSASYMIRDMGHPEVCGRLDLLRPYLHPDPDPTNGTYEGHSDTNGTHGGSSNTNGTENAGEP